MDYKVIFWSICEIADRLKEKMDWPDCRIKITYNDKNFYLEPKKYIDVPVIDNNNCLIIDLTDFEHLKTIIGDYDEIILDKEMYLVKCIHSLFVYELRNIYPVLMKEQIVIFYKIHDVYYPLLINEKNILK